MAIIEKLLAPTFGIAIPLEQVGVDIRNENLALAT